MEFLSAVLPPKALSPAGLFSITLEAASKTVYMGFSPFAYCLWSLISETPPPFCAAAVDGLGFKCSVFKPISWQEKNDLHLCPENLRSCCLSTAYPMTQKTCLERAFARSTTLPSLKSGTFAPTAHATSTAVNELTSGAEMRGVLSNTLLRVTNYSGSRWSTTISEKFRITVDLVPIGAHAGCFPEIIWRCPTGNLTELYLVPVSCAICKRSGNLSSHLSWAHYRDV